MKDFNRRAFRHASNPPSLRRLVQGVVLTQPDGSVLICKHADLNAIYRDTTTYISDKKAAFTPKFGLDTPLFEHYTTSLVFNDPPLHTRVRRIMTSALTPRQVVEDYVPKLTATSEEIGRQFLTK